MVTKWAVQAYLPHMRDVLPFYPYGGIGILADFFGIEISINHATNTGAVWGVFAGYQYVLLVVRLMLIVALLGYLVLGKQTRASLAPLSLIVVGAIGNVFDIFFYGHVVDMFHFRFWGWDYAIFNLADAFISIGIGWLALLWLVEKRKAHTPDNG
jgi:signal peptidase II